MSPSPRPPSPTLSSTRLEALRKRIYGRILVPCDEGYDVARQTWNATTFEQHPAVVVMPRRATDVAAAVEFARASDLSIAVQGGGHGHPRPADGALLINFTDMARVRIASSIRGKEGVVQVEAGARWREVITAAARHGLAPLNGFADTVGVVGYTLGGGIGWLVRQYGAASGSVQGAQVVTSDAQLLQVSQHDHGDLFWGLRGGGGNFGIVTSLEFKLHPVREVFGGFIAYPLAKGMEALTAYAEWTRGVPETLTSAVRLIHYPPVPLLPEPLRGQSAVVIMMCYNGSASDGEALVQPLRSIGLPLLDTFRRMAYAETATIAHDPPEAPPVFTASDGGGLRDLSPDVIESLLTIASDRAAGIFLVEARHLGGALGRQPAASMSFRFSSPWFFSALAAAATREALQVGNQSIDTLLQALDPVLTGERLINAVDAGRTGPHVTRAAYTPENYLQFVALKEKYDPDNVFRFNHNIAPQVTERR